MNYKNVPDMFKVGYSSSFADSKSMFEASLLVFIDKEQNSRLPREVIHKL